MDRKYTALVLAILVAAAEANTANLNSQLAPKLLGSRAEQKWNGLGLSADVNDYVDDTIQMIVPFIEENGLDPMDLPDAEEGFEVKVLLITYSAWLKITEGYMTGLVNVERNGDQKVNYFAKMLRVRVSLNFSKLEVHYCVARYRACGRPRRREEFIHFFMLENREIPTDSFRDLLTQIGVTQFYYNYLVKVMQIGPTGGIRGSLSRFVVNVDILLDFNNDEIQLQEFSLTDIGRLRVRLVGNILVDWLVNPVITVFVMIFDTIIMKVVEANINAAVQSAITTINANVKEVIRVIESYN